jgi:hypothetical protein
LGGFNPTCTSCIFCYHATQIPEIFHILRLFMIYHNRYMGWLHWDSHHFSFPHIHLHSKTSYNFKYSINHSLYHRVVTYVFHTENYLSYHFESSKSFKQYLTMGRLQTTSLSNSSFNLHTPCLTLVRSCFNILIHAKFADRSSFAPVDITSRLRSELI